MVRKIIWSARAQNDRKTIFSYWNRRNGSNVYSKKLNKFFIDAVELLSTHPKLGRITNNLNIRVKIVRDYIIIYEFNDEYLIVHSIFDTRQNPTKLKQIIK